MRFSAQCCGLRPSTANDSQRLCSLGLVIAGVSLATACNKRPHGSRPPEPKVSQAQLGVPSQESRPAADTVPAIEPEPAGTPDPADEGLPADEPGTNRARQIRQPIAAVMSRAISAPGLDPERIAATKTGQSEDPRPGKTKVAFCASKTGETEEIRTTQGFYGDPEIDTIARETVSTWRFRPHHVAGEPVQVCSIMVFNVRF